LCYQTAVTT